MRGTKMPYEQSTVTMAQNSETLVLRPFAMTWVLNTSFENSGTLVLKLVFESVYASPEWYCGKEEQNLV
jgi:hypothetical protein